jgi:fatty acid desaturase
MKANPTIMLFGVVIALFAAGLAVGLLLPHPGYLVLASLALFESITIFVLYIVIHDCAHRTASKNRPLNDMMMVVCGVVFLFDPYLYRRLHLTHHAHTNEESDPDRFTAGRYLLVRWAKSFLIAGSYYVYSLRHFRRNTTLLMHLCFTPVLVVSLCLVFAAAGKMAVLLACWFIPAFVAIGCLGFVLTAWPHHPAEDTSRIGSARNLDVPRVLQLLLGNQHLHLVHHYSPTVPWHRLPAYWRENKERLVAKGAAPVP